MTGRELAYRGLTQIEEKGGFSNLVLKDLLRDAESKDKGLITALVYGVTRERIYLDYQIERFCDLKRTPSALLRLLRMGAFQLCRMDKIPPSAAVNETVKLAKKLVPKGAGCCNGVLRKIAEQGECLPSDEDHDVRLSVQYSMPLWLVKKWKKQFGEGELEPLLSSFSQSSSDVLRVNWKKSTPEEIKELDEYCLDRFIELVPCQNTLGHMGDWLARRIDGGWVAEWTGWVDR